MAIYLFNVFKYNNILLRNNIIKTIHIFLIKKIWGLGIGVWGLGIGDWAQSPIPNPQSPIPNPQSPYKNFITYFL